MVAIQKSTLNQRIMPKSLNLLWIVFEKLDEQNFRNVLKPFWKIFVPKCKNIIWNHVIDQPQEGTELKPKRTATL